MAQYFQRIDLKAPSPCHQRTGLSLDRCPGSEISEISILSRWIASRRHAIKSFDPKAVWQGRHQWCNQKRNTRLRCYSKSEDHQHARSEQEEKPRLLITTKIFEGGIAASLTRGNPAAVMPTWIEPHIPGLASPRLADAKPRPRTNLAIAQTLPFLNTA